jgi:hypothetical protein
MNHIINIKAESFPWQFKFIGALAFIAAVGFVSTWWWLSLIFLLVGAVIFTTHSGTSLDAEKKMYREYNAFLFMKMGEWKKYDNVEKIFINASKESQQVHPAHTNDSATFTYTSYDAYLKFSTGQKIYLASKKDKVALMKMLKGVAEVLETELVDYSI